MYGSDRLGSRISSQQNLAYGSFERGVIRREGSFERRKYKLRSDAVPLTALSEEGAPVLFPSVDKVGKRKNAYLGFKRYELKNHLGNVMATITDRKQSVHIQAVPLVVGDFIRVLSHYQPEVVSISDYYPFGMIMPGRSFTSDNYRYGFQGQEKDDEIKGVGNSVNFKYRMHDPRLGRFFAVDPLTSKYPHYSPYSFSGNKVIAFVELEGAEELPFGVHMAKNYGNPALGLASYAWDWLTNGNPVKDVVHNTTPVGLMDETLKNGMNSANIRIDQAMNQGRKQGEALASGEDPQMVAAEYEAKKTASDIKLAGNGLEWMALGASGSMASMESFATRTSVNFAKFSNLDDLAGLFKGQNLSSASDDLIGSGWNVMEGDFKSRTIYTKQVGKQKYFATWEPKSLDHSSNNKPASYWKISLGKSNTNQKNTRRVGVSENFKDN